MSRIAEFPADSHLRVYNAPRPFTADEKGHVQSTLSSFVAGWKAEGMPVTGDVEIVYDQFIVVAADESNVPLSG